MFAWLGDVEGWDPALTVAVRWFEAATAAAEGSRFVSALDLPSGMDWGMWVGELLFGAEPRNSLLVENLRDKLLPNFSGGNCETIGDIPSSGWLGLLLLG